MVGFCRFKKWISVESWSKSVGILNSNFDTNYKKGNRKLIDKISDVKNYFEGADPYLPKNLYPYISLIEKFDKEKQL